VLYIIFVNKCTLFADRIRSSVRVVSGGEKARDDGDIFGVRSGISSGLASDSVGKG
jgi:hypothetical protein